MDGRKVQGRGVEEDRGCRGAVGTVPVEGAGHMGIWVQRLSLCWNLQVFYK
jgi:hypothetical protein